MRQILDKIRRLLAAKRRAAPIAAAAFIGLLAACSTSTSVSNDVAATEIALTAAERVALIYTTLPRCSSSATLCSTQAMVDKIKSLDQRAYTAVEAAKADSALISAAWVAISTLQSAIPTKTSSGPPRLHGSRQHRGDFAERS